MNGFEQLLRLDSKAVIVITDPDAYNKIIRQSGSLHTAPITRDVVFRLIAACGRACRSLH